MKARAGARAEESRVFGLNTLLGRVNNIGFGWIKFYIAI